MKTEFAVSILWDHSRAILECSGELDGVSVDRFVEAADLCIARDPRAVRIDLSRMAFIGSEAVIGVLELVRGCRARGIGVEIFAEANTERILRLAGIGEIVPIFISSPDGSERTANP